MVDLNTNDAVWMADVSDISLFNMQVVVELEETSTNAEDIIEVETHNMGAKDAMIDNIAVIHSISSSDSDYYSFPDSSNPDPTSFNHINDPWRRYILILPYSPDYDGPRPPFMPALRQGVRNPRMFIGPLLHPNVTTSIHSSSYASSITDSTVSTVDVHVGDIELEYLPGFEDTVIEEYMEFDSVEERENNFMDNGNNCDPFLYFYDLYIFDAFNVFEPEEKEEEIYFDSFTNIPSPLQTLSILFLDSLTSLIFIQALYFQFLIHDCCWLWKLYKDSYPYKCYIQIIWFLLSIEWDTICVYYMMHDSPPTLYMLS